MGSRAERVEEALRFYAKEIRSATYSDEVFIAPDDGSRARAALALPADAPAQPAPEGAGEAVAFNEDVEREQATDELARECFDGPVLPAREADLWIDGWLARARYAHPTPRAEAASAEAVREELRRTEDAWIESMKAVLPERKQRPPITGGHKDTDVPPGLPSAPRAEAASADVAPPTSLPSWEDCSARVANSDTIARRVAGGGYGNESGAPEATALHRFIYEYDDADPVRSSWFMHQLDAVLNEARSTPLAAAPASAEAVAREAALAALLWKQDGLEVGECITRAVAHALRAGKGAR